MGPYKSQACRSGFLALLIHSHCQGAYSSWTALPRSFSHSQQADPYSQAARTPTASVAIAQSAIAFGAPLLAPRNLAPLHPRQPMVAEAALVAILANFLLWGSLPAVAENELQDVLGSSTFQVRPELVQPECIAKQCSAPIKACTDSSDCVKGLACTAKCMGDAQCTVGCFARYWNPELDNALSCTIEDAGCIKIGVVEPGADSLSAAPKPPKPIIAQTPASLEGKWYKVMGWNSIYDCYDCQLNSFTQPAVKQGQIKGKQNAVDIDVSFAMPRDRMGQPSQNLKLSLHEQLVFDTAPGSHRTARTQGKLFGLTFWENWYIIGENNVAEAPFKFVYYTGKTVQNRYEGAFVYARKPELPRSAMPSIYRLAREAGFEPDKFCVVDNKCFAEGPGASNPPAFTPSAQAAEPVAPSAALDTKPLSPFVHFSEFIEDPQPPARAMFSKLKKMGQMREYDANGVHSYLRKFDADAPTVREFVPRKLLLI